MKCLQTIKDTYDVLIPISEIFKDLNTLRKIAAYIVVQQSPADQALAAVAATPNVTLPKETLSTSGFEKRGVLGNFKNFIEVESETHGQLSPTDGSSTKDFYLKKFVEGFNAKTQKTKNHVQKYRKPLADNRASAGFRPNTKEMIYPIHCYSAKGSKFVDIDGNEYIDFSMGFGVNLFGHSPDFIETAIQEQLQLGMCVGPQSFLAGEIAQLVTELTGLERTAFVNSGTEAVMTAIRLARAATKRTKIVIFNGSYHGHFDGILARGTKDLKSIPVASGIPENMVEDVIVLEYGSEQSLEVIDKLGESLAAVLVEPVQSRFPEFQPKEFLKSVRQITKKHGVAFIWDEVITGFRIHPGGAQAHFEIEADLATYGKILGGGMPIGAVAGSAKFMDFIDGGYWEFGDQSYPAHEMTFFAGTFSKHPLAMAASFAVLKKLKDDGQALISEINQKTAVLCSELNSFFKGLNLDIQVNHFGSLFRFKANLNLDLFFALLNQRGFYVWEGRNLFVSTAHSADDLEKFKKTIREISLELIAAQYFPSSDLKLTLAQTRFLKLSPEASLICVSAKIKGFLDIEKLQEAFAILIKAKDIFRLRIDMQTERQSFVEDSPAFKLQSVSLRSEKAPWRVLDQKLNLLAREPMSLSETPAFKVQLYEVAVETHVMAIVAHHLVFDGWTMTLLFDDLAKLYNSLLAGQTPELLEALTYQSFLKSAPVNRDVEEAKRYWESEFPIKALSVQQPTSLVDYKGQRIVFDLELKMYEGLKAWCKTNKLTAFMFLLGCFARTLMKRANKDEIVIGIPVANRDYRGSEKMFGNCANLLPVKIRNLDESAENYFKAVKEKIIGAYQHMNYPYERLILDREPIFDTYFNLEPTSDLPEFDQASLIIYPFPIAASEFKLMFNVTDCEYYYHCEFDFQLAKLSDDEVIDMIDDLKKQVRDVVFSETTRVPPPPSL